MPKPAPLRKLPHAKVSESGAKLEPQSWPPAERARETDGLDQREAALFQFINETCTREARINHVSKKRVRRSDLGVASCCCC